MALEFDFQPVVFDDRSELMGPEYFPARVRLVCKPWHEILEHSFESDTTTFGLIVTRGHKHDAFVLQDWIKKPFGFLGMIGSQRKRQLIFEKLQTAGIAAAEELERVACPVGLDIGAVSVNEIAISILAQCIQKRAAIRA